MWDHLYNTFDPFIYNKECEGVKLPNGGTKLESGLVLKLLRLTDL
jgi:hypothetical protein